MNLQNLVPYILLIPDTHLKYFYCFGSGFLKKERLLSRE
jgi:hypothetical protein